jgi:hypothetical protein
LRNVQKTEEWLRPMLVQIRTQGAPSTERNAVEAGASRRGFTQKTVHMWAPRTPKGPSAPLANISDIHETIWVPSRAARASVLLPAGGILQIVRVIIICYYMLRRYLIYL